jgi:hypothetical protein
LQTFTRLPDISTAPSARVDVRAAAHGAPL